MIEVEMVTSAGVFVKGQRYIVGRNHWLARSGYAKVVREIELVDPGAVGNGLPAANRRRVARRSKKVNDGPDSVEPDGGSPIGAGSGSVGRVAGGGSVTSGDEADGSEESSAPVGQPEA